MVVAAIALVAPLAGVGPSLRAHSSGVARAAARAPFTAIAPAVAALLRQPPASTPAGPTAQVAVVERPLVLRSSPGGAAIATLTPSTEFGSRRALPIVGRRGPWLAVLATELPNNQPGWIPSAGTETVADAFSIDAYITQRVVRVYRYGRLVRQFAVAVGSPATPTPTGRFAATDALTTGGASPYGCCVLALSGHQTQLAPGWTGGDRLAIHSTTDPSTVGDAASLGCLRADAASARWLIDTIPLGTVVTIRQ